MTWQQNDTQVNYYAQGGIVSSIEEVLNRPSEKDTEEISVPMTADGAMAEMNKLSKALDEAKAKAKKEVGYEKSTAKMSAFAATGLSLFALSLIFSSASGFFPGLAIILCVFGAVFFAMACVGASDKARQKEEQWNAMIEVWEKDLAKATGEWLKIEGVYDFSNPEMP